MMIRTDNPTFSQPHTTAQNVVMRTYRTSWQNPPGFGKSHELRATEGIQTMCEHCASQVRKFAPQAFAYYRDGTVKTGGITGSMKLQRKLKCSENIAQSFCFTLANACEFSMEHTKKLEHLVRLLSADYENAIPSFMFFGEAPRNLISAMARYFGVSASWTGRTLRGFRKKIDHLLPYRLDSEEIHYRVTQEQFRRHAINLLGEVEQTSLRMMVEGRDVSPVISFQKKVQLIHDRAIEFADLLERIYPSKRCLKTLSIQVQKRLGTRTNLRSALRSIIARAIVNKPKDLLRHLTIDNCITVPFAEFSRKALPLELLMGPKYNIRRGNAREMTQDFSTRGYTVMRVRVAKEWVAMHVIATKKMRAVIAEGAEVASVRVLPPRGPSRKVLFDIIFKGSFFRPSTKFLADVIPRRITVNALGIDPNRLGEDVFVIGSTEEAPLGDLTIAQRISERLLILRDTEIPRVSRARSKVEARGDVKRAFKLKKELGLLHSRMERLKTDLDRVCGRELARVLVREGARVVGYESSIGDLTTQGTRGALAKAITHMPKRVRPILKYVEGVMHEKGNSIEMIGVNPRVSRHVLCGGRLLKTSSWDVLTCEECGERVNRHHHAAKTYAHRALSAYQGSPQTVL